MQDPDLSDDELLDELRRARFMLTIAENAGEADAEALWASVVRSIENEQRTRAAGNAR